MHAQHSFTMRAHLGLAGSYLFLFVSFLLLLLATLSVPYIKSIYIMKAAYSQGASLFGFGGSVQEDIKFGVFGLCLGEAEANLFGFDGATPGHCSDPRLGYSNEFTDATKFSSLISSGLAAALVLHPLACGFTFLAMLTLWASFPRFYPTSAKASGKALEWSGVAFTALASLFAFIAFICDIAFVAKAKDKAGDISDSLSVSYGSAVWMTLVATLLLWFTIGLVFFERRKGASRLPAKSDPEMQQL